MKMLDCKSKDKYEKYKNIPQTDFSKILSNIEIIWNEYIIYDGNIYFDLKAQDKLPLKHTQNISELGEKLLPSDSSFRKDIKLRMKNKNEESQNEK
jgi:hypothetical protein